MGTNQETLIYIEDKDKLDASVAANSFAHSGIKDRVYINTLGAKLGMKYLASEDIDVSNIYNMHSIKKILEEVDIADIMLSNIHIDVRVVYDENTIFVPKAHFEYGLTPDIYLVFQLAKDSSCVSFLGYFEPSLINKNNANADYYFIEKEKLSPAVSLKRFISNFKGNTNVAIQEEDIENSERIIMAMADNDVSEEDRKYIIKQLTKSAELRDKFIEYENFETLSYKAMTDPAITKKEIQGNNSVDISDLENIANMPDAIESPQASSVNDEASKLPNNTERDYSDADTVAGTIIGTTAGTVAGAAAGATIGGTISATAGEILSSMDTAEAAINTVEDVANTISNVSDIASDGVDAIKSGIDEIKGLVGTSEIENGQTNTISFEDVDFLNANSETANESIKPVDTEKSTLSTEENSLEALEKHEETSKPSLTEVPEQVSAQTEELNEVDNISLEDPESLNIEPLEEPTAQELKPLNANLEPTDVDIFPLDGSLEEESLKMLNDGENGSPVVENLEQSQEMSQNEFPNLEDIDLDSIDSSINAENPVQEPSVDNAVKAQNSSDGFGNALLDNLSNDELENITIDDLGINEDGADSNVEDISSNDLLSQIDDVLNTSATQNKPIAEIPTTEPPKVQAVEADTSEEYVSIDNLLDELNDDEEATLNNAQNNTGAINIEEDATSQFVGDDQSDISSDELDEIQNANKNDENENLGMLFNDTESDMDLDEMDTPSDSEPTIPGQALFPAQKKQSGKKTLIVAAALAAVVAAASANVFLKHKDNSASDIEPINAKQNEIVDNQTASSNSDSSSDDLLTTNTPSINENTAQVAKTKEQVKELKNATMNKKAVSSDSYLEVSKLVWNVPDNLSYNPKIQNYLRTTGKSLKLALSADLLLATEYAYTNQMKVNINIGSNGEIQQATIGSSSGSTQIDNIMLQSVKETLSAVKPPVDELKGQNLNLALIIYF